MIGCPQLICLCNCLLEQRIACNRGKCAAQIVLACIVGISACAHAKDNVAHFYLLLHCACRSYPYYILHIKKVEKLIGINPDCRHPHATRHDAYLCPLIRSCVSLYAPDIIDKNGILKKILRDKLRAERVTGHQHRLSKGLLICINMWCRNKCHTASLLFLISFVHPHWTC